MSDLPVKVRTSGETTLPADTIEACKHSLRGTLLQPDERGYDEARALWNAMIDRRPALIARCLGVADVIACVHFARQHDLRLSIKGGGHNISGLAVCDGGLMLDMSLMRGVWVDPAPWLPKAIHGRPIVALVVCHTGTVEAGAKLVAPIKAFGSPAGDVVQRRPYVSQQSLLDATQPQGWRYYWKSEYVPTYEPEMLAQAIEHAQRIVSPHSAILLFPLDGALNRLPADHSPAGNRDATAVLNITAAWERAEDDQANIAWACAAWQNMRRFSTGGTYINFLTAEEGTERIHAAYGSNYERRVTVKTQWDPGNLFRMNKNVAPRAV
jgi:FAD/FMN-containing dehydrogenase